MSSSTDDLAFDRTEADLDADAVLDVNEGLDPDPGHGRVARLLTLAAENADELLAEANAEAGRIEALARADSEELLAEARDEAEQVKASAVAEADKLLAEQTEQAKTQARSEGASFWRWSGTRPSR